MSRLPFACSSITDADFYHPEFFEPPYPRIGFQTLVITGWRPFERTRIRQQYLAHLDEHHRKSDQPHLAFVPDPINPDAVNTALLNFVGHFFVQRQILQDAVETTYERAQESAYQSMIGTLTEDVAHAFGALLRRQATPEQSAVIETVLDRLNITDGILYTAYHRI